MMQVAYINPRTPAPILEASPIANKQSNTTDSSSVEAAIILFCYDRCVRTPSKLLMQEYLCLAKYCCGRILVIPIRAKLIGLQGGLFGEDISVLGESEGH